MRTHPPRRLVCGVLLACLLAGGCGEAQRDDDAAAPVVPAAATPVATAPAAAPAAAPVAAAPSATGPFAGGAGASKFPPGAGPRFRGSVALDPAYADMDGRHTLWIIVRSVSGAGAPIAVQRVDQARFPVQFDVGAEHTTTQSDDSYDILKGELKVTARLSRSGNPIKAPGDIECEPLNMKGDDPPASLVLVTRIGS
jgi:hypothetical protein